MAGICDIFTVKLDRLLLRAGRWPTEVHSNQRALLSNQLGPSPTLRKHRRYEHDQTLT